MGTCTKCDPASFCTEKSCGNVVAYSNTPYQCTYASSSYPAQVLRSCLRRPRHAGGPWGGPPIRFALSLLFFSLEPVPTTTYPSSSSRLKTHRSRQGPTPTPPNTASTGGTTACASPPPSRSSPAAAAATSCTAPRGPRATAPAALRSAGPPCSRRAPFFWFLAFSPPLPASLSLLRLFSLAPPFFFSPPSPFSWPIHTRS